MFFFIEATSLDFSAIRIGLRRDLRKNQLAFYTTEFEQLQGDLIIAFQGFCEQLVFGSTERRGRNPDQSGRGVHQLIRTSFPHATGEEIELGFSLHRALGRNSSREFRL
jgi:hypothetical protein